MNRRDVLKRFAILAGGIAFARRIGLRFSRRPRPPLDGLVMWVDARDLPEVDASGVTRWVDKSGSGNDLWVVHGEARFAETTDV